MMDERRLNMICPHCGYTYPGASAACPLCARPWEAWELRWSPLPQGALRQGVAAWLSQLVPPAALEIAATGGEGLRLRLYLPPGAGQGAIAAWAALTRQQTHWLPLPPAPPPGGPLRLLRTGARVPNLAIAATQADPLLALGGGLLSALRPGERAGLVLWLLGQDTALQARLRALAAYNYGSESGVASDAAPNPWGLRLGLLRLVLGGGLLVAGISGGALAAGLAAPVLGALGLLSGGVLALAGALGLLDWLGWRSVPRALLEARVGDTLLRVAFTLHGEAPAPALLAGHSWWQPLASQAAWPAVQAGALPLPAQELAALVTPPQWGEGSGVLARAAVQDTPAPPPAPALRRAPLQIGRSVATGEVVGLDAEGHGMVIGGSRSGKSSLVYALLLGLLAQGERAPGLFLVDPHNTLADAFLQAVHDLPAPQRAQAIGRLRVITPDQPEVLPLNLLALEEFSWAANALVQVGRRLWEDYWGPRMQAALLALCRLAHAWNQHQPQARLGLLHVVFAAFNTSWRHQALGYLPPAERMGALALDALLGQFADERGRWDQGWVTEVISPVLSKVMALELSPWLFAALHQGTFVDLEGWLRQRAWVVLRAPSGELGREGARLVAGVVYNVFEAAFRRVTLAGPIPYYIVIDEAQEIGAGMRLEALLSEGSKFGARLFVLAQSLALLRQVEGFEALAAALWANTSAQAFFSPDPEDAEALRAATGASARYGPMTLDLPALHCWLRARVEGQWQPPTLVRVAPLPQPQRDQVQGVIREVIAAHAREYAAPDGWQEGAVARLSEMLPPQQRVLLDTLLGRLAPPPAAWGQPEAPTARGDPRRLGWEEE